MDASPINENKWISIVKCGFTSPIKENKWISIVMFGGMCNKWK